jgi:hypothetical protein
MRRLSLKNLTERLKKLNIDPDKLDNFFVEFDESALVDLIFGKLTAKENQETTIVMRTTALRKVLGGISTQSISRGLLDGIESNSDGTCTVDMSADWIRHFQITAQDFQKGTTKFVKTAEVKEILGYSRKSNGITSLSFFKDEHKLRVGRIWLIDINRVYELKLHRDGKRTQLSVVSE